MGDAKRRKLTEGEKPSVTPERQLLAKAAHHFNQHFVVAKRLVGGCYYISLALRHYLGTAHGLSVTSVIGFIRPKREGYRWSSHMWIEYDERITDLAVAMAQPPSFPGQLLIDGRVRKDGSLTAYSKIKPTDGVEIDIDRWDAVGDQARKEYTFYSELASSNLDTIGEYLKSTSAEHQIAVGRVWRVFHP
ncbi:hypothetical protein [Acidiphilium sp.]|uniref:hypothetical protein n=1 Tax=Acidiphilium sp. TaxID=527 RepID=UPI003CFED59D